MILSVLFVLFVHGGLLLLIKYRTAAALAATFLLFSLVTRSLSLVYVDIVGPLYSEELSRMVGGASSMPLFAVSILLLMVVLAYAFRPNAMVRVRIPKYIPGGQCDVSERMLFVVTSSFIAALYCDMLWRGVVPLLSNMDRLEYNATVAGPLHKLLSEKGFLLAGMLGAGFCMPRLQGRHFKFRFLGLYLIVLTYFALTGNRFSALYSFTSFFILPLAAVPAMSSVGLLPPSPKLPMWRSLTYSRSAIQVSIAFGTIGVMGLILHSVINVRGYDDPLGQLKQRILVQPVELWWTTWHDLDQYSSGRFKESWEVLFTDPIDPTRNSSIQLLMIKNLGYDRAKELLLMGQQYAGGYPEVLFELLGPWGALPAALAFCVPTVILLRMCVLAVCERRLLTAFMALYVYFGFSLLFIGGMLNFLIAWTFWVKMVLLFVFYVLERHRQAVAPKLIY